MRQFPPKNMSKDLPVKNQGLLASLEKAADMKPQMREAGIPFVNLPIQGYNMTIALAGSLPMLDQAKDYILIEF